MRAFSACQRSVSAASSARTPSSSLASTARRSSDGSVGLARERGVLDLELLGAALEHVELVRHGVDLDAQPAGGLVDEVDRLVGQEAVGDVALGELRGGDQRGVLDAHAVVHLVALAQAAQDRDRVGHGRLAHEHGREAALERRVLLDVLAVLVERRGADRAQLAAREHGLEQVGRVDRALGRAGARRSCAARR